MEPSYQTLLDYELDRSNFYNPNSFIERFLRNEANNYIINRAGPSSDPSVTNIAKEVYKNRDGIRATLDQGAQGAEQGAEDAASSGESDLGAFLDALGSLGPCL